VANIFSNSSLNYMMIHQERAIWREVCIRQVGFTSRIRKTLVNLLLLLLLLLFVFLIRYLNCNTFELCGSLSC
jgi:hypothetical protein